MLGFLSTSWYRRTCKAPRKPDRAALCVVIGLLLAGVPTVAAIQPESPGGSAAETNAGGTAAGETHETEEHGGSALDVVARLVNFVILVGTLVYLLRSPIAAYLSDRSTQIRSDLVDAAKMKLTAVAQIEEVDRRMKALPAELDALGAQGSTAIVAEEGRIRAVAAAERDRLLERARREINQQVRIAERALVTHVGSLAVGIAAERIRTSITDEDQRRLADLYAQRLKQ